MIAATELRHNDYFYFEGTDELGVNYKNKIGRLRVNDEFKYYVDFSNISNEMMDTFCLSQINPIPLTPEILEKAGFEKTLGLVDTDFWYKLIGIRTNNNGVCCFEITLFKTQYDDFGINLEEQYFGYCKHLHELQNKIYAISGQELTLSL